MQFWWVNHKQTRQQEIDGSYFWSPVAKANGARNRFYDNMRSASPGDLVFSYADGQIGRIGIIADFAISAPKPTEFGSVGAYWSDAGWLFPVQWLDVQLAVRPKVILHRLGPLLPKSHSPIRPENGNGNQAAYLAEVDAAVFEVVLDSIGLRLQDFVAMQSTITQSDFARRLDDLVEDSIVHDEGIDTTTRQQLTKARRGQGLFRKRVFEVEPVCRITGIDKPNLLIASHVKPWRACGTAAERLDGFNGLMLAPHADFLFDRGLIGFEDNGHAIFSSKLSMSDAHKLGLNQSANSAPQPIHAKSRAYFDHHRRNVFIP